MLLEHELRVVVALPRLDDHDAYLHARERVQLVSVQDRGAKVRSTAHLALLQEPASRVGLEVGASQARIALGSLGEELSCCSWQRASHALQELDERSLAAERLEAGTHECIVGSGVLLGSRVERHS